MTSCPTLRITPRSSHGCISATCTWWKAMARIVATCSLSLIHHGSRPAGHIRSGETMRVRTKLWSSEAITCVTAALENEWCQLTSIAGSVWQREISRGDLPDGIYRPRVVARDTQGQIAEDNIRIVIDASAYCAPSRAPHDQDNPLPPWHERGLLSTQLGLNKN